MTETSKDQVVLQAEARRDAALAEAARWDAFIRMYMELHPGMSPAPIAQAPARRQPAVGVLADTERAVIEIIKEQGRDMPTRELIPLLSERGLDVGGKDPIATLSARLSRSSSLVNVRPTGWRIKGLAEALEERAASPQSSIRELAALFTTPADDREAGQGGGT